MLYRKQFMTYSVHVFFRNPAKMTGNNLLYLLDSYYLYKLVLYILMQLNCVYICTIGYYQENSKPNVTLYYKEKR